MAEQTDIPPQILRHLSAPDQARIMPLYKRLRGDISRGDLSPGQVISLNEIAVTCSLKRGVVLGAVALLRVDGLMETRRGVGARVLPVTVGVRWQPPHDRASQIAHIELEIRQRLADGTYPVGTRIPVRQELGREFGVAHSLVVRAVSPVIQEGYLWVGTRREGTLVTSLVKETDSETLLRLADRQKYDGRFRYTVWGESKTIRQWSEDPRCVVSFGTLKNRIFISGWPVVDALTLGKVKPGRPKGKAKA